MYKNPKSMSFRSQMAQPKGGKITVPRPPSAKAPGKAAQAEEAAEGEYACKTPPAPPNKGKKKLAPAAAKAPWFMKGGK